jgi:lipopolysaccharide export system permease protein
VIKKLDKLILKAFIGPFFATFFVTLFVLVMQFFWKYIDDLVGKGLDILSILKLTGYTAVTSIPLALPLAILLSSIMTFGNLGESFELVAVKSAGIPLLRFMRPLFFTTALLCCIAFLIANYVMPVAFLKFTTMLYDIRVAKPAFDIKEGIFYDKLPGVAIKIGKKDKEGNNIYDVVIYESQYVLQDNIIVAEKGRMDMSPDKKFLLFNLENGWRYQEKGPFNTIETDYYRIGFKQYKKSFDLSSFDVLKTPDSVFKGNNQMLNVRQLDNAADSIQKYLVKDMSARMNREVSNYFLCGKYLDSGWKPGRAPIVAPDVKRYQDQLPDTILNLTYMRAADKFYLVKSSLDLLAGEYTLKRKDLRYTLLEWHKKFSLSFACFVLFMIGAPLGSIIRKGGLGMPLVIAVVFFMVWHLLNMFGDKFVRQDIMTPLKGVWLSAFVLIPIGIFLIYKAMNDSQLFNNEFYYRFFKQIREKLPHLKKKL